MIVKIAFKPILFQNMPNAYPYTVANNKVSQILTKIRSAAKPAKFTNEFLKQLGFTSSNDRAIISILRGLGFLSVDGTPTEYYDRLKDNTDWQFVLGERIQEMYKDLFSINTEIHKDSDAEIKGAISRITGKDDASVARYTATFKTLAGLAQFGASPRIRTKSKEEEKEAGAPPKRPQVFDPTNGIEFSHNIQIQLPATTDISVYNAIFKSLRENLLDE